MNFYVTEYANLDSTLDQLDSCLDALESKNDDLFARLQDLLEDSRQARKELETGKEEGNHASKATEQATQDLEKKSDGRKDIDKVDQDLSNLHVDGAQGFSNKDLKEDH